MNSLTRVSRSTYSSNIVRLLKPRTYPIASVLLESPYVLQLIPTDISLLDMSDQSNLNKDGPVGSAFKGRDNHVLPINRLC